jgi:hypothetical protein
MIGPSAPLLILGKMQSAVIRRNIISAVFLVPNFGIDIHHALKAMLVNMHMVFLRDGFILLYIERGIAKMPLNAQEGFVSLLTHPKSFVGCTL